MHKTDPNSFCVLIRVYNRMQDLEICVDAIRQYWKSRNYYLLVVSNGSSDGYKVPESVKKSADHVIEISENAGHQKGNSQLLLHGISHIPESCAYTILLEADTWVFTDDIIQKYSKILERKSYVWASAEWVEKHWSLAVDFAIVSTQYIKKNPNIFNFTRYAEAAICQYLQKDHQKFIYITENMPVHLPHLVKHFYNPYEGRNHSFPKSKMVTHHIEDLELGIESKKMLANYCAGTFLFPVGEKKAIPKKNLQLKILMIFLRYSPRSRWFSAKKTAKS